MELRAEQSLSIPMSFSILLEALSPPFLLLCSYLDLTERVSVVGTPEIPPAPPASLPGQAVKVGAATGLAARPVCPAESRAVLPDPATLTGGVTASQPEGVMADLREGRLH